MGRCTAWNTCRCRCLLLALLYVPLSLPLYLPLSLCLPASPKTPSHVVCKNDSGILIRHFKFNSVGLCLAIAHRIMCRGRRSRGRQLLRVLCLTHLCAHVCFGCCEGGLFFGIFALYGAWHLTATVSFLSFFIVSGDSRCSLNQRCPCHCFSFSPPIWFLSAARAACSSISLVVYNGFYRAAPFVAHLQFDSWQNENLMRILHKLTFSAECSTKSSLGPIDNRAFCLAKLLELLAEPI